jgi:hypothetical protein
MFFSDRGPTSSKVAVSRPARRYACLQKHDTTRWRFALQASRHVDAVVVEVIAWDFGSQNESNTELARGSPSLEGYADEAPSMAISAPVM